VLTVVSVPTFPAEKEPKQIDTANLTSSDFHAFKEKDLFMYYSIPIARKAAMHAKEIDSMSLGPTSSAEKSNAQLVSRQKRVSTECYPDFDDEDFTSKVSVEEDDALDSYMKSLLEKMEQS
jgi:hypothetical protein